MRILRVMPWCLCPAICCGACTAFLPQRTAPPEGRLPARFTLGNTDVAESNRWWQDFESEELNQLIDAALQENLTLRQLWARLEQAGCQVVMAASGLYPQITLGGDAGYRRTVTKVDKDASSESRLGEAVAGGISKGISKALAQGPGGTSSSDSVAGTQDRSSPSRLIRETRSFGLSLAANYEVDVWGRVASAYRAARFDFAASREDLESTAMTVVAEVTERWVRILEQQELQRLLSEQLATNKTYLELVELRFRKGQVSALDVYQQRQAVSEIERLLPLSEAEEQVLRHDLAVLLGKLPMADLAVGVHDLASLPNPPGTGIPAELLARRPDVRGALSRLQAADHRVASARADLLPAILLNGGIGYDTGDITHLFDDWFLNLAAALTAPLFDGFRRQAEVDRTLAVVEQRLSEYRLAVLTAIKEVEDALIRERKQREHIEGLSRQLEDARNALRESSGRYQAGLSDYLPVLAALERTQSLARTLVVARRELLVARIDLYRALGGTWTQELEAPIGASNEAAEAKDSES
ncbi:MAG: TolC family protein [Phycisphaerae bacterium]